MLASLFPFPKSIQNLTELPCFGTNAEMQNVLYLLINCLPSAPGEWLEGHLDNLTIRVLDNMVDMVGPTRFQREKTGEGAQKGPQLVLLDWDQLGCQ